ncbi:hypothetical protein [Methyloversatilis thermotolerans]|uniref:hypothetical protein n=1 Tax=Methyloversatilis thermotolerans TaxID=1346290 RepID=UPI0003754C6C|nr:hypothetical protein [Methyloversatilis thermotolerans]
MPVLLHIGYGKAASTTLQDWFDRHPEIWRFSEKALLKGLAANKKVCVLSDERLSLGLTFDATSGLITGADSIKAYQRERCLELKALFPHAHVLIVTRGFSQFIHSFHAQYVAKGGVLPFLTFFDLYAEQIADLLDYNYLVGIYEEAFDERVITIPVELLRRDADRFYGIIEARLGLSLDKRPRPRQLNPRPDTRHLRALPFISRAYFKLLQPFGPGPRRAMHKLYVKHVARGRLGSCMSYLVPRRLLASPAPASLDLSRFHGLADVFATREVYAAFKADYLLGTRSLRAHHTSKDEHGLG